MIDYKDYSLGLKLEDFETDEEKYIYFFLSKPGNITSGGKLKEPLTLYQKIINYMMKQGRNTGKKEKCHNQLLSITKKLEEKGNSSLILLKAVINGMPKYSVRRQKKGSGVITRAVYLSLTKRLIFSLKSLFGPVSKSRKRKKNYTELIYNEIYSCFKKDSNSEMIRKKNEAENMAKSSNY